MDSTSILIYIAIAAAALYMVIRQFREREISWRSLLIFPLLIIYLSYDQLRVDFSLSVLSPIVMLVGMLIGLGVGFFRSTLVRIRVDEVTGAVFSRPTTLSLTIWIVLLILRVGADVFSYTYHTVDLLSIIIGGVLALFLGNTIGEKCGLYRHYLRNRRTFPIGQ